MPRGIRKNRLLDLYPHANPGQQIKISNVGDSEFLTADDTAETVRHDFPHLFLDPGLLGNPQGGLDPQHVIKARERSVFEDILDQRYTRLLFNFSPETVRRVDNEFINIYPNSTLAQLKRIFPEHKFNKFLDGVSPTAGTLASDESTGSGGPIITAEDEGVLDLDERRRRASGAIQPSANSTSLGTSNTLLGE